MSNFKFSLSGISHFFQDKVNATYTSLSTMDPNDVLRERLRSSKSHNRMDNHVDKHAFHRDTINSLCALRNGMVISGSRDKRIVLNNCDTGDVASCWDIQNSEVTKVAYHNTAGKKHSVLSGGRDGNVNMWLFNVPNPVKTFPNAHRMVVSGLVYQNDQEFVTGSRDGRTKLWNVETGKCIYDHSTSRNIITHMCIAPFDLIGQSSEDKTVKLWDPRKSTPAQTFPRKQHIQMHCEIVDANCIASCSNGFNNDGCEITIYDIRAMKVLRELRGHDGSVTCLAPVIWNEPKKLIVSVGADKTIRLWRLDDGNLLWTEESPFEADSLQCCCYSDGVVIISGGGGRLARYQCKNTAARPCLDLVWKQKPYMSTSSSNQQF